MTKAKLLASISPDPQRLREIDLPLERDGFNEALADLHELRREGEILMRQQGNAVFGLRRVER